MHTVAFRVRPLSKIRNASVQDHTLFAYFGLASAIGVLFLGMRLSKTYRFLCRILYNWDPCRGFATSAVTNLLFFAYFGFANAIEVLVNENYKKPKYVFKFVLKNQSQFLVFNGSAYAFLENWVIHWDRFLKTSLTNRGVLKHFNPLQTQDYHQIKTCSQSYFNPKRPRTICEEFQFSKIL